MKFKTMILLLIAFIGLNSLTLQETIDYAIKNGPQIEIMEQSFEIAKLDEYIAISNFFPSLTFQTTYTKLDSVPVMSISTLNGTMNMAMGVEDNYKAELKLTVPIFMGGKLITGYRILNDKKDIAQLEYEKSILDTKMAVIQTYYSIMLMDEMIGMTESLMESAQEHYNTAQSRYKAGTISKLELLSTETQYKAIIPQLEQLKSQKANLLNSLKLLIGYKENDEFAIDGEFSEILPSEDDSLFLNFNPANKRDVRILEKNVRIVRKLNNISKMAFLPNIVGFGSFTYKNGPTGTNDTLNIFNQDIYMDESLTWGVSIQMDLFKGGKRVLEKIKTGKEYKKIKMAYANKINQVEIQIENLINNYKVSSMNIETYKSALNTAEEAFRMAKEQYAMGIIDNNKYLDAESNYIKTKANYAQGVYKKAVDYYVLLGSTESLKKLKEVK